MTKKKIAIAIAAAALAGTCAIGGTLAWLTATTNEVTNTFTVGNIQLNLDELPVDEDGIVDEDGTRVTEQKHPYKVYPSATIKKDPKVDVIENSEDCWLYVYVTNNTEAEGADGTAIDFSMASDWQAVSGLSGLYRYKDEKVTAPLTDVSVFANDTVTVDEGITDEITGEITVKAYAHQAEGVEMTEADAAAIAFFTGE
ncbi:MAG TPA: hypothetical protein IAB55_10680 [Candidatus Merdivicinus faecavium]|nr:hypothetical protein [Candidatus Merdivicinus faecavium]